jgi:hypothetical protein
VVPEHVLLDFFPYFDKNETRLMRSSCCLCIPLPQSTFECLNQSLWNLVCISCYLSPSQRHIIPPISLCVCMCIHLSLLGNGSVKIPLALLCNSSIKTLPRHEYTCNKEELLDASFSKRSVSHQGKYTISSSENLLFLNMLLHLTWSVKEQAA